MNVKVLQYFRAFLIILGLSCSINAVAQTTGLRKVVIDAGHGGKDPGCISNGVKEKDINLSVALKFGELIKKNYPDVKIIYTRDKDVFIDLDKRSSLANKEGADLFISIHADAVKNNTAKGASVFVMGLHKSKENLDVAMRENDVVSYEDDYKTKYEGYELGSAESYIIFSLMQYGHLEQSMKFAHIIQRNYISTTKLTDRGTRQAGFLVLYKAAMPSVLVELGFLTNESDRKFLNSQDGQNKAAKALFNAFSEYKGNVEGKLSTVKVDVSGADTTTKTPASGIKTPSTTVPAGNAKTYYTVQMAAGPKSVKPAEKDFGKYTSQIKEHRAGTVYKYCVGQCTNYQQALDLQKEVRKVSKDAYIIGIVEGKVTTVADVRKVLGQ